jgi:GNAT superfamily N-acetyltransferase
MTTLIPIDPEHGGDGSQSGAHPAIDGVAKGSLRVTVTYLEMESGPAGPPLPAPHGEKLALMRLEQPTLSFYRYLYDTIGEPWLWYARHKLATNVLEEIITDPRVEILVLYAGGVPAGYAELDQRKPKVTELAYFGLMPEFIGRRLGPFLLDTALRRAWDADIGKVTVNTCTFDHPKALTLYQRFGFKPVRQENQIIKDPRLSGDLPMSAGPHIPFNQ